MIEKLSIQNFKSVKDLQLSCKRVNIFIGDPNSGKSNLLESFSLLNKNNNLTDHVRFESVSQLFFDFDSTNEISISVDNYLVKGSLDRDEEVMRLESYLGYESPFLIKLHFDGKFKSASENGAILRIPKIRSYRFRDHIEFAKRDLTYLEPPFGDNISFVVLSNKGLRNQIQILLEGLGYKLLFKHDSSNIEIYREFDGFSVSFPFALISDTVRRMIFYLSAIESNTDATIVLEEPESNTFPLYIKYLAERIASYSKNQFFITTHNPYFLQSIIEKTPLEDLTINLVEMEDHETRVTTLKERGVEEILALSSDVFLNFKKLLDE
jgi:AAA15 family ATPase/GTPase